MAKTTTATTTATVMVGAAGDTAGDKAGDAAKRKFQKGAEVLEVKYDKETKTKETLVPSFENV